MWLMNKLKRYPWKNPAALLKLVLLLFFVILPLLYLLVFLAKFFIWSPIRSKLAYDSGGPYIEKCNSLNNQKLSYEAITSLNGYIFRTSGTGGYGPDSFTKAYYEDVLRGLRGEKTTSDIISNDYKVVGILRDNLLEGPTWACEITVDPATSIMKTKTSFYSRGY